MGFREDALALNPDGYWALDGDGTDEVGGNTLTEFGTGGTWNDDEYAPGSGSFNINWNHLNYLQSDTAYAGPSFTAIVLCKWEGNNDYTVLLSNTQEENVYGWALAAFNQDAYFLIQTGGWQSTGSLNFGSTYFMAVRFDEPNDLVELWIGSPDEPQALTKVLSEAWAGTGAIGTGTAKLKVGGQIKASSQNVREWRRSFDEIGIWDNTLLTDQNIADLYATLESDGVVASGNGAPAGGTGGRYDLASPIPLMRKGDERKYRIHRPWMG